jgi:hypothetical protein
MKALKKKIEDLVKPAYEGLQLNEQTCGEIRGLKMAIEIVSSMAQEED